ncbi:MAG: DUF4131 domain-containing protein, partial [Acidobacteria bacterium]|nr:DUF4131 domain-containing protein [Acidobacteriota bacterium]
PPPELEPPPPALMTLEGCVVAPSALSEDRARFLLELAPGARVQVTLYAAHAAAGLPRLDYGQRVELEARVRRPHNFRNPGGFDYVRYLARRDIHWTASARAGRPPRILPGSCGRAWLAPVMRLRVWMLRRIRQLYPGERYNAGMMQALLIGESFQLEKIWTERFRSTGTYHALVISGTHVAVLAGFFLFLLRLCFLPPRWAALATVLAAWLYALVAGWQPPVIRSAAGLSLFLIGRYFGRAPRVLNLLAAVAILFLLLDPEQLFEPSFQLSFLAVAAIAALAMPLIERTSAPLARGLGRLRDLTLDMRAAPRVAQFRLEVRLLADTLGLWTAGKWRGPPAERHLPSRIQQFCDLAFTAPLRLGLYAWELFLLSALVQIGLALPMIVYFHRAGLSGLSANIFVVPLTGILIPAGFVAVLSGSQIAAAFCAGLLALIGRIVGWHALLEPAWRIPAPPLWLAIALAAFLVAAASLAGRRRWRLAAAAGVAVSLALLFWHPFRPQLARKSLELTAIDVGQGESLLVGFPQGRLMLVDGGGIVSFSGREPRLDIGEDVVSPYLWSRSIRRIDVLALTHAHQDHIGGAAALIENFSIGEIWTGAMPPGGAWETLRRRAAQRRIPLRSLRRGPPFGYAGAGIEVLAPSPGYAPAAAARNNDSLVLRVSFGRH